MTAADEVEVTVTVPDAEPDTDGDGIPDAIEIGRTEVIAENAAEDADEALASAGAATVVADAALETSYNASEDVAALREVVRLQGESINALIQSGQETQERLQAAIGLVAAQQEPATRTPLPPEDAPESKHWLTRRWF
jgi:hypothetical protein